MIGGQDVNFGSLSLEPGQSAKINIGTSRVQIECHQDHGRVKIVDSEDTDQSTAVLLDDDGEDILTSQDLTGQGIPFASPDRIIFLPDDTNMGLELQHRF